MQSCNEHTDKINSEHASPSPQVNAQTLPLFPSSPSPQTSHIPNTRPKVSKSFNHTGNLTVYVLSPPLHLLHKRRKWKPKALKHPSWPEQKLFFSICSCIENFSRLLSGRCEEVFDRFSRYKLSFCLESISTAPYLFTLLVAVKVHILNMNIEQWTL